MISSLWTLCQACPSVSAGKLDGKYRWTEYRDVPTADRVIEQPPQCSGHSVNESSTRARKDVEADAVLQQQQQDSSGVFHDFMEPTLAIPAHLKFDNQLYLQVLRRSQSEGPHHGVHSSVGGTGVAELEPGPMAAWVHGRRRHVTDQQRPDHWFSGAAAASASFAESRAPNVQEHQKRVVVAGGETASTKRITGSSEYQLQFSWPAGKQSRRMPESLDSLLSHDGHGGEREAAGLLSHNQNRINAGTRSQEVVYQQQAADELLHHQQSEANDISQPTRRRRYKTEYKKKFRPFSLYQYVDGRFQKSSSEKIPATTTTTTEMTTQANQPDKDTWYGEVIELRKKAGEYKYRGLGGELMPQHMADLYAKQFDVWEQVSRRSSLSALALAATTPRPGSEKDSTAASSKRGSPIKMAPANSARPGQAQLVLISSRKDNRNKASESTERGRREPSQHRSISAEGSKSRSKSAKPARSATHHGGHPQQQQQINNVTAAIRQSVVQRTPARSASLGPERRMPKSSSSSTSTGSNNKTTPVKARPAHNNDSGDAASESAKVIRNHKAVVPMADEEGKENRTEDEPNSLAVIDQEPLPALIKALPEPTRVKSPEQLVVRSPDPVNWTVPLGTGKTFTVTQNIRAGEAASSSSSRPLSELKVSMTVRPPPAAPVHSAPVIAVKTEQAQIGEPVQQQQEIIQTVTEETPIPAPVGVPAPDNAIATEENQTTDIEMAESPLASPADDNKPMDVDEKPLEVPPNEVNRESEKPVDIQAQEKEEEKMKEEEASRLPAEEEPNGLADDPLGAAIVLGNKSMTAKEESSTNVSSTSPPPPIQPVTSIVPGTTLRRLEDPTPFLFSRPGTLGTFSGGQPTAAPSETIPKAPRYRVLEAPTMVTDPIHPKLEDVDQSMAASSPNASPLTSRSLASDVLEKARTRFDRFWTKKESTDK